MAGIYIHIPFCKQLCNYCDFHFSVSLLKKEEMIKAMLHEMELRRNYLQGAPVRTLYIGGGTPSVCTVEELKRLIDKALEIWQPDGLKELTIEANPEDLTKTYIRQLKNTPVTRFSIGIQSLDDSILPYLNRRHNAQTAIRAIKTAQDEGFGNISLDLMYGIPLLTTRQWEDTLVKTLSLHPAHVSAYHLTIEPHTVFGNRMKRGLFSTTGEKEGELQYGILEKMTRQAGFRHYEVSNFARPGYEAVHNGNYWKGEKYIGIGPSAHSYDGSSRRWNVASNKLYLERIAGNTFYEEEILSLHDRYNEYVMTGLRTANGVDPEFIGAEFGTGFRDHFFREADVFVRSEKLHEENGRIVIASEDFLISDHIISHLFYTE